MTNLALLGLVKGILWLPLLYVSIRFKAWENMLIIAGAWTANLLIASDHFIAGSAVGVATVPLLVFMLIDRLYKRPDHVRAVAAAQVAEARSVMHDALSDARAWEARALTAERRLCDIRDNGGD